jgi:exodeoxyribonuclease VII small subunit
MEPQNDLTFEQALAELDRIVRELEDGKVGLEESLARYEQGVALLKKCYAQLRRAELRVQELVGIDEQGNPITKPFQHAPSAEK